MDRITPPEVPEAVRAGAVVGVGVAQDVLVAMVAEAETPAAEVDLRDAVTINAMAEAKPKLKAFIPVRWTTATATVVAREWVSSTDAVR